MFSTKKVNGGGSHCVWYQIYPIFENQDLRDATAFACVESIHAGSGVDALFVKEVGGSGEADVDVRDSENLSPEGSDEETSKLLNFNPEMQSSPEKERKQSKKNWAAPLEV